MLFQKQAPPNLAQDAKALKDAADQRQLVEGVLARWRQVGTASGVKPSFNRFQTPEEFEKKLEQHLREWLRKQGRDEGLRGWSIDENGPPYPGLEPYQARLAPVFPRTRAGARYSAREDDGGRQPAEHDRSCEPRLPSLLILGLAARESHLSPARRCCPTLPCLARLPGWIAGGPPFSSPARRRSALAEALFAALPELAQGDASNAADWAATVLARPAAATGPVKRALERADQAAGETHRLLMLVDQLEEVLEAPASERAAFGAALLELTKAGQWVVATLRSDRYAALLEESSLRELKDKGATHDLLPPDRDDMQRSSAGRHGWRA